MPLRCGLAPTARLLYPQLFQLPSGLSIVALSTPNSSANSPESSTPSYWSRTSLTTRASLRSGKEATLKSRNALQSFLAILDLKGQVFTVSWWALLKNRFSRVVDVWSIANSCLIIGGALAVIITRSPVAAFCALASLASFLVEGIYVFTRDCIATPRCAKHDESSKKNEQNSDCRKERDGPSFWQQPHG